MVNKRRGEDEALARQRRLTALELLVILPVIAVLAWGSVARPPELKTGSASVSRNCTPERPRQATSVADIRQ